MADTTGIRMLTINEAAKCFPGLTKYRIREMCINGDLPCIKAGRKYLICEQVLVQHLTEPATVNTGTSENSKLRKIY